MRLHIVNMKESELLPLKVEPQMAIHVELVYFVDCYKLREQGSRTKKKNKKTLNFGEPRTLEKGGL